MRDAEIGDLDRAVVEQEYVGRLDIAVNDALAMRIIERIEHLRHDADDVRHAEALVGFEIFLELATLDEFHGDEPHAAILAEVVNRNDVGVAEPSGRLRLTAEARDDRGRFLAGELIGTNRLEGDDALDHRVVTFVDHAHRAATDFAPQLVFAEVADLSHASPLRARRKRRRRQDAGVANQGLVDHLYLLSISHTDFCTSRCTIVSSETPPCCACDTPSTDVDFAPTSIFSSV